MRRPAVAHMLAAVERFGKRLGPQFAGAVTYFSVLSMVPIIMLVVSALGLTFTVLRPDLLPVVQETLENLLGDPESSPLSEAISGYITSVFNSWRSIGLIALLTAAYAGSKWVKNLKHAIRAMWKDRFFDAQTTGNFIGSLIADLLTFFGLLLSLAIAVAVTTAGQTFSGEIINWLGLAEVPGISLLLQAVSIAISLVASWMLMAFLFVVLPGESVRLGTWLKATITGAVLLTLLQRLAGLLVNLLSGNKSANVFGPIIVLMIVFNLLATIILMLAAWVGTADTWEAARAKKDADRAAGVDDEDEDLEIDGPSRDHEPASTSPPTLAARRRADRWAASIATDDLRAANYDPARVVVEDPDSMVKQDVAARGVRVGMGVGYGVGAATGIGLGAAVAVAVGWFTRR